MLDLTATAGRKSTVVLSKEQTRASNMGLSKKLGGTTQKMGVPASPVVPYKWSNQTYTVAEILKKFKLPCVVQCATDDSCTVVWSDFVFDLKQPLLLYSKRSVQKVHAVSVRQTNDVIEEIGPPLAIPADYEGWFGAAPKGISKAKRHFRIESLVNSAAHRFMVTTKCPAFTTSHGPDGGLRYIPHDVMPGEILRRVCVLDSDPDDPDCPDLVRQHGSCLECLDEKDEDVVIPLSHATLSYEVGDAYPDEESRVFQLPSLVEAGNTKLPRILTLIHGDPPLLAYAFTGMVRCYSVFNEETILAATLEDPGSRCLELITDSCVRFRLGLNEAAVKKTCEYTSAFQMCDNFGAKFVTKIKVAFTLKPDVSDSGVVDVSTSESTSDMQDVEANSEFDIRWGSIKKAKLLLTSSFALPDMVNGVTAAAEPVLDTTVLIETGSLSGEASPIYSQAGEPEFPQHHGFTEHDIVKLMLNKGMMESTAEVSEVAMEPEFNGACVEGEDNETEVDLCGSEAHLEGGSSPKNRVTDNPLFYFFQRHPEQNPWKPPEPTEEDPTDSEDETSLSDRPEENMNLQKDRENPLSYLFTQPPVPASSQNEVRNPLSYLFEPMSNEHLTDREPREKGTTDKKQHNCSDSANIQNSVTSGGSVSELNHYNQAAYRTARVYSGSDDDDDDDDDDVNEDEDHCTDSDDSSEIEPSGISKELYIDEDIQLPIEIKHSDSNHLQTRTINNTGIRVGNLNDSTLEDTSFPSSPNRLHKSSTSGIPKLTTAHVSSNVGVSYEETEAVNDLFTLVDVESNKDASFNTSKCSHRLDDSTSGLSERTQRNVANSDTVQRLNTLLEEVSEIVTTSSDRILDSNKDLRNLNPDCIISTDTVIQSQADFKPVAETKDNAPTVSGELSILRNHNHSGSLTDKEISPPPKTRLDAFRLKHRDLKSSLHGKFNPELNISKSEASKDVLLSSNMRDDGARVEEEKLIQSKSWKLHKTISRQKSLSSIFSVIGRHKSKSDLSKTKGHATDHSHHENTEINNCENESPPTSDSDRKYPFPYRNQRVLSLARGNMALFPNLDRLNSSNGSGSSNRSSSSSLDNTLNRGDQGVHRLVVIGDYDLIVQDNLHNGSEHDNNAIYGKQYGHPHDPSLDEINAGGSTENELTTQERYVVSNSGRFRTNKLTCPRTNVLQTDNEEEFLHEDYV